ncbi:MAG TPA: cytochrome c peroxidase [Polyangiales bacterium]|nr:cytochrome c peroxidase [Polyangiales bacterium]
MSPLAKATLAILPLLLSTACGTTPKPAVESPSASPPASAAVPPSDALLTRAQQSFAPLPQAEPQDAAQVALGRKLFFETRMSADGKVGCVTCHLPEKWATDGLPQAKGTSGRINPRNAPTVFNAFLQTSQHWRGDRESVEDQARKALLGPPSFGLAADADAVAKLKTLGYLAEFQAAFPGDPEPISVPHWGSAIGAYERTLLTPTAFDAFLRGDGAALSGEARAGLTLFLDSGCADCHDGPLLGGRSFKKFGRFADYVSLTHSDHSDAGRFDVTHDEADRAVFKVAALRNVSHTGPYFHDGSVSALPDAVSIMAKAQLNADLTPQAVASIVTFLDTLTGAVPETYAAPK